MSELYQYAVLFLSQYIWLMSMPSVVATVLDWFPRYHTQKFVEFFSIRTKIGLTLFLLGIFLSGFFAWREDYKKYLMDMKAAHQENKIENIEEKIEPKILTEGQKNLLIFALKQYAKPNVLIDIGYDQQDSEYAIQWQEVFDKSNWKTSKALVLSATPPRGIKIYVRDAVSGHANGAGDIQNILSLFFGKIIYAQISDQMPQDHIEIRFDAE